LYNVAKQHYWRVAGWYEFDDLIQDGFLHYSRIVAKYPNVTEPKQLMRLFQRTFTNHIHDLAKRRTRYELEVNECDLGLRISELTTRQTLPDVSETIATLPPVLRRLLDVMQNDPRTKSPFRLRGTHRETTNEFLCRLVGVDPNEYNLLESLRTHLTDGLLKTAV
jgi:hypothetical protein